MNTKRRSSPSKSKAHKGRRPRFLSLRLQFPVDDDAKQIQANGVGRNTGEASETAAATSEQLNLFPLQPGNLVEDRESNDHENVAFFFSVGDAGASSTLTGLLDHSTAAQSISSNTNNSSRLDCLPPSSPASMRHEYCQEKAALERNALRNRDRDSIEEKWVCYSEVVKEEEVTSCAIDPPRPAGIRRVKLKLDYEEIMNAWSDKGPLYIDAVDNTQIVPDISHHFLSPEPSNYSGLSYECNVSQWIVPGIVEDIENNVAMNMRSYEDYVVKMGHREASVLRYKEKRQTRLFSKKIRYQVRKLNAEKRPRLKGRFVKRL